MTQPPLPDADDWPRGATGFVALLGRPNTGKSTLMNALLSFHLAAVSAKPQTTRTNWLGILTTGDCQIMFLDAPGVHAPKHDLDEAMDRAVERALEEADVVVCLADPTRPPGAEDAMVATRAAACAKPVILAVNKCDTATPEQARRAETFFRAHLGDDVQGVRIAAVDPATLAPLVEALKARLPQGPFLYPTDALTDRFERDIGAELVREALLEQLRQEVPHCMAVRVDEWRELDDRRDIQATLFVEREQHKHIVIGKRGSMIKRIRVCAEHKLEDLCGCPVRLELWVKVASDWRRNQTFLRDLDLT